MVVFCALSVATALVLKTPDPKPALETVGAPQAVQIASETAWQNEILESARRPTPEAAETAPAPVTLPPSAVVEAPRPLAKRHVQKNRRAVLARAKAQIEFNRYLESELAVESADESMAINAEQPELLALGSALEEPSLAGGSFDAKTQETQVDVQLALDLPPLEQVPVLETAGVLEKNDFAQIRSELSSLSEPQFYSHKFIEAPRPRTKAKKPSARVISSRKAPAQIDVAEVVDATISMKAPEVVDATTPMKAPEEANPAPSSAPSIPFMRLPDAESDPIQAIRSSRVASLDPSLSSSNSVAEPDPTPSNSPTALSAEDSALLQAKLASILPVSAKEVRVVTDTQENERVFDTDLFGRVVVGAKLKQWLKAERAHIELYLQPLHTRDPQQTRYLSFAYPQESFRDEAKALRGRYELVAGIFRPSDLDSPYAEIRYPQEINADTARQHLKFHLDTDTKGFSVLTRSGGERRNSQVFLSFFKGAQGNYETPAAIPFAEVKVIGFPEFGVLHADKNGDLVLPPVPNYSQLAVEVRAKGYYRTFRTIPIFAGDVHQPIYLGTKSQLMTLAKQLAGVSQLEALAQVLGRVFDPASRNPLENERVELVDHAPSRGSYFRFFSDSLLAHVTTMTGFFSYFNVASAFRYLERPDSNKRTLRVNVRPSSAYYVELGRGGMRALRGRLVDPNGSVPVAGAKIQLVGDSAFETLSDADGKFSIPGIDFPSGMIAVDVSAPNYRLTRHTIPWNPRQTDSEKDLFMVRDRFIEESIASSQSASVGPNPEKFGSAENTGNIVAGTYHKLFEQNEGCISVELWSVDQQQVMPSEHGPFPFRGSTQGPLCLTKDRPGFNFLNLPPGEYMLKWKNKEGQTLGAQIDHVGMGRDSVAVN